MERGEDLGDAWQETVVLRDHPDELLQGLDGFRSRELGDCCDLLLGGGDAFAGEGVAEEFNFFSG